MDRHNEIINVTLVGGAVNVALLAFKFAAGLIAGSAAMVADAVHSLSDFITDVIVLVFVKISGRPADKYHTYGYGKYETLATTLIGLALLVVGIGIVVSGSEKIISWAKGEDLPQPGMLALWAALASILLKELTFQYTIHAAKKLDSPALRANAWHHRSDALSSIGTAVGIGGAILLGNRWTVLDPAAGVIVGLVIVKISFDLLKEGMGELMERSLPDEVEKEIEDIIGEFPDVGQMHHLRTRRVGSHYAIELHVRMDGKISLDQAHSRTSEIEKKIRAKFGDSTFVTIHTEPFKKN